jgi:hypothetical protein
MRKEFLVERQGKTFCLYSGLLDLAHQQGLRSIQTNLVQVPSETNKGVAIVTATVTMERDGVLRVFTGIGDAAEVNVAPAMRTCLIRMAETRSKARALRDAVNIGVAAFEELGEEDAHDGAPERGYAVAPGRSVRSERAIGSRARVQSGANGRGEGDRQAAPAPIPVELRNPAANPRTEEQANAVRSLCRRLSVDPDALVKERLSLDGLADLSQAQAGDLIRALSAQANGRAPAALV